MAIVCSEPQSRPLPVAANTQPMAPQVSEMRVLLHQIQSALRNFQDSGSSFRILKTVTGPPPTVPEDPLVPSEDTSPRTVFILDSSFNPPSVAHRALAASALQLSSNNVHPKPQRLLLLLSTMNADKAPSAASFDQRLAMMAVFAGDLLHSLTSYPSECWPVPIDIGVTTAPYYTDKTKAIESTGSNWYPRKAKHVHLVGYDTLTRIFAAKYYSSFDPPLSALNPYFDPGHELRATLRPADEYGTVEEQTAFHQRLADGEMESEGGKREWARQVHLVPPNPKIGVSSTAIRKAAKAGDWEQVGQLCTPAVAHWVEAEKLYEEDDRGTKMA